ncbi:MAG: alpha/beta fold hydrolase [Streptosporangiaceae bacterium]|jgi:pimeloyl-ACP methyl ester carboxylesterase
MTTTTIHGVKLDGVGNVDITVSEQGEGRPFLLLHGGGGPDTVASFGQLLADSRPARIISPVHPGFGGTPRPEALSTVRQLAGLYVALLDQRDLSDVTVVGNSIGGWIAAEMALLESRRVSDVILVNAVGIDVPGHPVADFFSLTLDQVFQLSFHNPEPFRIDPATLPEAAQAIAAGNRASLATYAGTTMTDPSLIGRLAAAQTPVQVLWGDSDQIVDPDYGRAFAAAIPGARFQLLTDTGHMPQIETPDQLLHAIWD